MAKKPSSHLGSINPAFGSDFGFGKRISGNVKKGNGKGQPKGKHQKTGRSGGAFRGGSSRGDGFFGTGVW